MRDERQGEVLAAAEGGQMERREARLVLRVDECAAADEGVQRAEHLVLGDSGGASLVVVSRGRPSRYEPQAVIVERLVLRLHVVRC